MVLGPDAYCAFCCSVGRSWRVAVGDGPLLAEHQRQLWQGLIGVAMSAAFTCWALMAAAAWLALSA
jgi:hypothetical protein